MKLINGIEHLTEYSSTSSIENYINTWSFGVEAIELLIDAFNKMLLSQKWLQGKLYSNFQNNNICI